VVVITKLPLVQRFFEPSKIENWAVVNFSARCDVRGLVRDLIKFGEMKGIVSFLKILCNVSCNIHLNLVPCPKCYSFFCFGAAHK
jgi:hypothetical protein